MKLDIQRFAVTKTTTFSESNVSIPNNTSTLKITIYFSANNDSTYFSSETLYCTCNGVTQSAKVSHPKGGGATKTFTFNNIKHNADGTKSVSWSWNCNTGTNVLGNVSASGTRTLTKIPRASGMTFSPNPVILGQPVTISLTKYIEGTTDTLTWTIGDATGTIGTTDEDSYIWTPPITLAELITNSPSGTCVISCTSYDGDTLIGTSTANLTLNVPTSLVPTATIYNPSELDPTMESLHWNVFVQNKSKIGILISVSGSYGSTISSIITTINGVNYVGEYIETPVLTTSGSTLITTIVTDSRGRTATDTKTIYVEPYTNPTITSVEVQRCLQDGTIDEDGTYLLYTFVGSISSAANNNSKLFQIGYKKTTDENYTFATISNNYSVNEQDSVSSFTISPDYAYDIIFQAVDSFMTTAIGRELTVGFDLMNFNASGKAMAIGKVSEAGANEELLEIDLPTKFYKDTEINNTNIYNQLFYNIDDVIELGSYSADDDMYVINGFISTSSTNIFITIPVSKSLANINTLTITDMQVGIRSIQGYVEGGGYHDLINMENVTLSASKSSDNSITLILNKSNGWKNPSNQNVTNNTLISIGGYIEITLT